MKRLQAIVAPVLVIVSLTCATAGLAGSLHAQSPAQDSAAIQADNGRRFTALEGLLNDVRSRADRSGGLVLFLFGAFCAMWAQNTRRDPWLWFFLGVFFNVFAIVAALSKNAQDLRVHQEPVQRDWRWIGFMLLLVVATFMLLWLVSSR